MRVNTLPTQDYLKANFDYSDGFLVRKFRVNNMLAGSKLGNRVAADGYIPATINHTAYKLHRLIWVWHNGSIPDGKYIDHINMDKTDNRIENMRLVSIHENNIAHSVKIRKQNTSGIVGINWHKVNKKWTASIRVNRKSIYLGSFIHKDEAIAARKQAEIDYGHSTIYNK